MIKFNVLNTVLNIISNYFIKFSSLNYLSKKGGMKKSHLFRVTLYDFLRIKNSPGGRASNKISLDMTRFVMTYIKKIRKWTNILTNKLLTYK